jgi:tetratricopeptide (TPR) repeat protein
MSRFNAVVSAVVMLVLTASIGVSAQDANEEYKKQLEEWEKKKEAVEKENAEKLAKNKDAAREVERNRALNEGNTLLKSGRENEALAAYDQALKADSTFARAWYGKGLALRKLRRPQEAVLAYKAAIRHDPKDPQAYFALGNIYTDLEKYNDAVGVYDQAVAIDPKLSKAYYQRGLAYDKMNKTKDAINSFKMATEVDPNYDLAFSSLGVALGKDGQMQEAVKAYESAVAIKPSEVTYYRLAETYNKMQNHQAALTAAENGLKKKPGYAPAAMEAGLALKAMGRYNEAVEKFQAAARDLKWKQSAEYQIDDIKRLREQG